MTPRILIERSGHRKAEPTAKTLAGLRGLETIGDIVALRQASGYSPARKRLLYLAARGEPRAVWAGPGERP